MTSSRFDFPEPFGPIRTLRADSSRSIPSGPKDSRFPGPDPPQSRRFDGRLSVHGASPPGALPEFIPFGTVRRMLHVLPSDSIQSSRPSSPLTRDRTTCACTPSPAPPIPGQQLRHPGRRAKISTNGAATPNSVARSRQARLNRLSSTVLSVSCGGVAPRSRSRQAPPQHCLLPLAAGEQRRGGARAKREQTWIRHLHDDQPYTRRPEPATGAGPDFVPEQLRSHCASNSTYGINVLT